MMTPRTVGLGIAIIAAATSLSVLFLPAMTAPTQPSEIFRPRTTIENQGRVLYIRNGCIGCHTQYIRPSDWAFEPLRVSQAGDYVADSPHLLGSERTGPDLSQEGGLHPDDWQAAHFHDPRFVRPASIMPDFDFFSNDQLRELIAYVQSLGGTMADARVARQNYWKPALVAAYARGQDANAEFLYAHVPPQWATLPNPYPADANALAQGEFVYEQECINCHGPVGDGNGVAAPYLNPKPFNFTVLKRQPWSGGLLYYQIMNGVTGSAMPYFKEDLESAKIWDVSNYIATQFIGTAPTLPKVPIPFQGAIPAARESKGIKQ